MTNLHFCIRTPGAGFPGVWSVFSHTPTVILPMLSYMKSTHFCEREGDTASGRTVSAQFVKTGPI